jgi:hypothetical protein
MARPALAHTFFFSPARGRVAAAKTKKEKKELPSLHIPTMFAKLAAVIGQPALPFTLGEQHAGGGWAGWAHYAGTAREGGAPVSVWRIASSRRDDPRLEAARHGVRKLKTVCVRGGGRGGRVGVV